MIVEVEGYTFHLATRGDPAQPAVVFLHGFLGNCRDWENCIASLADTHYCVAVDLPGHGQTRVHGPASERFGMHVTAEAINAMVQELGLAPFTLVGYSMGGRLALYFAFAHPERLTALVLESASPGLATPEARAQRRRQDEALAAEIERLPLETFFERWYARPLFSSLRRHACFGEVVRNRRRNHKSGLIHALQFMGTGMQPPLWDKLPFLSVPALLITGTLDPKFTVIAEQMAAVIPHVLHCPIPDAGHAVHLENTNDFIAALRNFISRLNRKPPFIGAGHLGEIQASNILPKPDKI